VSKEKRMTDLADEKAVPTPLVVSIDLSEVEFS
jgi:hypothetical protein